MSTDSGTDNVNIRKILATTPANEIIQAQMGVTMQELFTSDVNVPDDLPLVAVTPWDPCDYTVILADLVHVLKNIRSQLFAIAEPNPSAVAKATEDEARICGNLQMQEPVEVQINQTEQRRANAVPAHELGGGVKGLVTPAPGTACTVNGSIPGAKGQKSANSGAPVYPARSRNMAVMIGQKWYSVVWEHLR